MELVEGPRAGPIVAIMFRIVWNNLRHDRLRFTIAVVGVAFAISLITIQGAILLGAIDSSSLLVRTCDADLWIVPESTINVGFRGDDAPAAHVPGPGRGGRCSAPAACW